MSSHSLENSTPPRKGSVNNMLASSDSSLHIVTEPELPEGGIAAWCTVLGAFLADFCGFGYMSAFGVYQGEDVAGETPWLLILRITFYSQQYLENESSSAISWIGGLATFLVTGLGPVCGPLFDHGYFYHVFITGAAFQSLSIFMLSLIRPGQYYQVLLAQGLASGLGQGLMFIPNLAIVSHHFKRRKATMMSIVASGTAFGGIANTIMLNKLLNGPMGFKQGVRISATYITVLLFLSCILMRPRYNAVRREANPVNFWKATKRCFTEVPAILTILGFTFFQVAYLYPFSYFQVDSIRHGLSDSFAFYSLVIINAGSFVGRFSAGFVLPYTGVINLTIATTIICAVLIVGMIWLGSVASVVVLGALYGIVSGMNVGMMGPMLGLMSDPAELGLRMGVGFAITGVGGLVGSPICGALLTRQYLWYAPALFCGGIALLSSALFVGVRFSLVRGRACSAERRTGGDGEEAIGTECDKRSAVEA